MTTIYLVRHGQTDWNVAKRIQGQTDTQLTEEGREQAARLSENLKGIHFDAVAASDLQRAHETAVIASRHLGIPVETDILLRERSYGSMEGRPFAEFQAFFDNDPEGEGSFEPTPDIESDDSAAERMQAALSKLATAHPNGTVLVVSHGNATFSFLRKTFPERFANLRFHDIKNGTYIILAVSDGTFRVTSVHWD